MMTLYVGMRLGTRETCWSLLPCVPLPPPTAVRPPHRTENEACCVWKNAAVKQPSVGSLAFKTERFIPAVKNPLLFQPLLCTSP